MDKATFELLKLMREEFGVLGPSILSREMKNLGFDSISSLSDDEKNALIDNLKDNVFDGVSEKKRSVLLSRLRSILDFSERGRESFNRQAAIDFLMGRPI